MFLLKPINMGKYLEFLHQQSQILQAFYFHALCLSGSYISITL